MGPLYEKNYADEELNISKEAFEVPENLTINVDCDQEKDSETEGDDPEKPDLNEEIDF